MELKDRILDFLYSIRAHTTCKLGFHCSKKKWIKKYDGGKLPALCRYCRLIVKWNWMEEDNEQTGADG